MIMEYHADADMLYIKLSDGESAESEEVAPGIVVDFDDRNRIVGIEIEDAKQQLDLSRLELKSLPLHNVIFSPQVSVSA